MIAFIKSTLMMMWIAVAILGLLAAVSVGFILICEVLTWIINKTYRG